MSAKTSIARREAFFAALSETGNQTIAAERARVSRAWVQLHRSTDPDFKARCVEAVAAAKARLSAEGATLAPPGGWGAIGGEELVVRGTNGRRVQIARAALRQFSPRVEGRFLAALAATCNVKAACAAVGMTAAAAYKHRQRWPGFARRWDEAIEIGYGEIEAKLVAAAGDMLEAAGATPDPALGPVSVAQAIHLLHMHKHRVHGLGKAPGQWRRPRSLDEVRDSILRKLEAIETMRIAGDGGAMPG